MHNQSTHQLVERSATGRTWLLASTDDRLAENIAQIHGLPYVLARLLARRAPENPLAFLDPKLKQEMPNPLSLKDMERAADRVAHAIEQKEMIGIFGDYDVDGASATSLLINFFRSLDVPFCYYIPDRLKEGYGPTPLAFEKLASQGAKLIITVDCGTTALTAMEYAQTQKLDVIVLDHHMPDLALPPTYALINPNRYDETRELFYLCAAGVTFMFLVALRLRLQMNEKVDAVPTTQELMMGLDLVGMATVCDVMPLIGLNRAYVAQGLKILARRERPGMVALADAAGLDEAPSAYHYGFVYGPRINAGSRLGNSNLAVQLLTTSVRTQAQEIAHMLEKSNAQRQTLEALTLEQAMSQAQTMENDACLVCFQEDWHVGVIGIVAGRLKDAFHKPTVVLSVENGIAKGSCRSVVGIDLGALIQAAKQKGLLISGGGHPMAGGMTLEAQNIPLLREFLNDRITLPQERLHLKIDDRLTLADCTPDFYNKLQKLSPFGNGNPTPRFLFSGTVLDRALIIGDNHLKLFISQGGHVMQVMAFRIVDTPLGAQLLKGKKELWSFAGHLKENRWGGQSQLQLILEDAVLGVVQ